MILTIVIVIAIVIFSLAILISRRPDAFHVSRSAAIAAPSSVLFEHVNDLHKFQDWSPWAKMDPHSKISYEGPVAGVGAKFAWESKKTGAGSMTILKSTPDELIGIKLDFLKPMKATNTVEFTFAPTEGGTVVTWSMEGKNNFIGKAFGMIVDFEKMCGTQFEQGLENLRELVASEVTATR